MVKKSKPQPPKGFASSLKLKNLDSRQRAYESYCKHLAEGWSARGWVYEEEGVTILAETMERYIREDPVNLDPAKKKKAEAAGFAYWEKLGADSMKAKKGDEKINVPLYQMFMRNKFGWDKESATTNHFEPDVRRFLAFWETKAKNPEQPAIEVEAVTL